MNRIVKVVSVLGILLIFLTACSEEPKPEVAFKEYLSNWEERNYEEMYDQLATEVKNEVNKQDYVERYTKIYSDIEVDNLKLTFELPNEEEEVQIDEDGRTSFTYSVAMDTIAGPIEDEQQATIIKEKVDDESQWRIEWEPTMILPELGEGDEVKLSTSAPTRGEILDRNGQGLAVNGQIVELGLVPEKISEENKQEVLEEVATRLNTSVESLENKLNASWVRPHYFVPITRVSKDEEEFVRSVAEIEGVELQEVNSRVYPYKEAAANLIGYVAGITAEDLEKLEGKGYSSTDMLGKKGLEMVLEDRLRGELGARLYIEKANKDEVTLAETKPVNGENIKVAIDIDIQTSLYEQLKEEAGAASAIHPLTGETLALVTSPSFDPNDFVLGISTEKWEELSTDPLNPLLNRVGYTYAPGSTFKPITAAIGLENEVITPEQTMDIQGLTWSKDESWGGYKIRRVSDPGKPVNLRDAFIYSDNIYFARTALEIGSETLVAELKEFGFGETLPFEYPFYDSKISNEGLSNDILLADTGYGQGELQMSPLHLAISYTPFLNEGDLLKPRLLLDEEGSVEVWHEDVISPETATIIINDLIDVIEDPNGTGKAAKINGLPLAGKTGTAELKGSQTEKDGKENGLFVAVNTEDPRLLIAMLIENKSSKDVVLKVRTVFEEMF